MAKKKTSKKTTRKSKAAPMNALADKLTYLREQCGLTTVAAADRSGGGGLPAGRNQAVRMEEATVKLNKNDDPMITWRLVGIGEENNNRNEFVNISLRADGKSFPFAKADVEAMGLDWAEEVEGCLATLEEHPDAAAVHIKHAEGLEVICDVWMKEEFKNVAITGLAEGQSSTSKEPAVDDGGNASDDYTPDDINVLSDAELEKLATDETEIDPDEVATYEALRELLIKELT